MERPRTKGRVRSCGEAEGDQGSRMVSGLDLRQIPHDLPNAPSGFRLILQYTISKEEKSIMKTIIGILLVGLLGSARIIHPGVLPDTKEILTFPRTVFS